MSCAPPPRWLRPAPTRRALRTLAWLTRAGALALRRVRAEIGLRTGAAHLHNTRGLGPGLTALAAYDACAPDSSQGGSGGCPFAPGASGNVVTRTCPAVRIHGHATGVDLEAGRRARRAGSRPARRAGLRHDAAGRPGPRALLPCRFGDGRSGVAVRPGRERTRSAGHGISLAPAGLRACTPRSPTPTAASPRSRICSGLPPRRPRCWPASVSSNSPTWSWARAGMILGDLGAEVIMSNPDGRQQRASWARAPASSACSTATRRASRWM